MRIGVDLGGTKIEALAIAGDGAARARRRIPTPSGDYGATIRAIAGLVETIEIEAGGKPAVICGATPQGWPRGELRFLSKSKVPVYPEPRRAAYALAKLAEYSEFLDSE